MKRCKMLESTSELPDCVISYVFSKLNLKDLVKTSTLSKHWRHEWGLRMDLNFDIHNMFHHNTTIQELQRNLPLFQSQFATRLDQFMLHYQGPIIRSIRINFPLGHQHSDVIGRLISKGIAKGVKSIELVFSHQSTDFKIKPYDFSFDLLSADTHSLDYLHLQNCLLVAPPKDFSGLNNLRTLVLHLVDVNQDLLQGLFYYCIHLVDFTLDDCQFDSHLEINTPTLLHLNIVNCGISTNENLDIIASNLSSFQYSCNVCPVPLLNIKAHMLSKFSYRALQINKPFDFSGLKNVTTIVFDGLNSLFECLSLVVPCLFSECLLLKDVTFKNCKIKSNLKITSRKLRHLNIIDCGGFFTKIAIDALNLSSFEFICCKMKEIFITAPRLLKVTWDAAVIEKSSISRSFGPFATLRHIKNLDMIMIPSQIEELTRGLVRYQNLRQLRLFIDEAYSSYDPLDYFWILDIVMASQHLQKLSLTIRKHWENAHTVGFKRRIRKKYAGFFHKELKYVELSGCVCNINVIELARHLLRNVNSLKQIIFSSRDKFYMGAGSWTKGSDFCCCWSNQNLIHEMLKDEVNEKCQLIIL